MNLEECKDFLRKETTAYSELKAKFIWLDVSEQRFEDAVDKLDEPKFVNMAKVLEQGKR